MPSPAPVACGSRRRSVTSYNPVVPASGRLVGWAPDAAVVLLEPGGQQHNRPRGKGRLLRRYAVPVRRGLVSAVSASSAISGSRPGESRLIWSVPCSMRFTERPRPIPGGGSTRYSTAVTLVTLDFSALCHCMCSQHSSRVSQIFLRFAGNLHPNNITGKDSVQTSSGTG
jgi:hypothetical protein